MAKFAHIIGLCLAGSLMAAAPTYAGGFSGAPTDGVLYSPASALIRCDQYKFRDLDTCRSADNFWGTRNWPAKLGRAHQAERFGMKHRKKTHLKKTLRP